MRVIWTIRMVVHPASDLFFYSHFEYVEMIKSYDLSCTKCIDPHLVYVEINLKTGEQTSKREDNSML